MNDTHTERERERESKIERERGIKQTIKLDFPIKKVNEWKFPRKHFFIFFW